MPTRSEDAPLEPRVVDHLHRARAAEHVDERREIAHRERVDEVGPLASRDLDQAQRTEVERRLDIEPDDILGARAPR